MFICVIMIIFYLPHPGLLPRMFTGECTNIKIKQIFFYFRDERIIILIENIQIKLKYKLENMVIPSQFVVCSAQYVMYECHYK